MPQSNLSTDFQIVIVQGCLVSAFTPHSSFLCLHTAVNIYICSLGISSGATAALFQASRHKNVPAVFLAEPDDMCTLSGKQTAALHTSHIFWSYFCHHLVTPAAPNHGMLQIL